MFQQWQINIRFYNRLFTRMFSRAFRILKNYKPILAASVLAMTYGLKKVAFDQNQTKISQFSLQDISLEKDPQRMLQKIVQKQICDSKQIKQGQVYPVIVTEQHDDGSPRKTYKIIISRVEGKLYAVIGHCNYVEPLSNEKIEENHFQDAIIFKEKLYCPYHGCAFDVRSGTVEYGPAKDNLSRFFVEQKNGRVKLYYPAKIPVSVQPKIQPRDLNDLRKVVILGGDHNATMGVINGLKQYDYGGEITVIHDDNEFEYPYRNDLLHRKLINFNKEYDLQKMKLEQGAKNLKNKKKDKKKKQAQKVKPITNIKNSQFDRFLHQKIYDKLKFEQEDWFKALGIQFVFNNEAYRIINKKFFPYVRFSDGSKIQFDGIVFANGFLPKLPRLRGITYQNENLIKYNILDLPGNIFAPFYNKNQHARMLKFLNTKQINNLLVLGMNIESLQFVEAFMKQFPNRKIKIVDINQQNSLTEIVGPDVGNQIVKQFIDRGVEFYIKVEQLQQVSNKMFENPSLVDPKDSISLKLDPTLELKGDCMVLFPNNTVGKIDNIKQSKYVDLDYNDKTGRVIVDPNGRTDTKRMFAAGSICSHEFFFTRTKFQLINANAAYEQGFTVSFNLDARNIPFHYVPVQTHSYFDKKIMYAGTRRPFNAMYIYGDAKTWDFIAFYALEDQIIACSATPSRQKQFQVIREAFRLQCMPKFDSLIKGEWTIAKIYKLIRKINKSGCYRDLVHTITADMNIPEVIWMQRENRNSSGPMPEDESDVEIDAKGYLKSL